MTARPDTTETIQKRFARKSRNGCWLRRRKAACAAAAVRWDRISEAYARDGFFREADAASVEADCLWAEAQKLNAEIAELRVSV